MNVRQHRIQRITRRKKLDRKLPGRPWKIIRPSSELSTGSTNVLVASASSSSEPLPTMMLSGAQPCSFANFSRNRCAVGFGYSRNRPSTAARIAASTRGDGGYGFSFVLSLINPLIFAARPAHTHASRGQAGGLNSSNWLRSFRKWKFSQAAFQPICLINLPACLQNRRKDVQE